MAERTLPATRFGVGSVAGGLRLLFVGTLTGLVGGMGTFLYINAELVSLGLGLGENLGLLVVGIAGVYTHVISADLRESISAAIIAFLVGLGIHVGVSIAPLWMLSYHPVARDALLPLMLGRAWVGSLFGYFATFVGAYCAAVLVDGFHRP